MGWSGVRVASDVSWLSHLTENTEAFHEYEGRVNELLRSHGGDALCPYDRRIFGHDDLFRCLATHCTVFLGGDVFPNPHSTDQLRSETERPVVEERHRGEVGVVVTDVHMPRMGGPELLHRVRENFPNIGVILMSGGGDDGIGMDLGGPDAAFLQKPFTSEELFRLVTRMLPR